MFARELEAELLARCIVIARGRGHSTVMDQREANVFSLAATVIRSQFPLESINLMRISEQYFAVHPGERLSPGDIIKNGWVVSLPRLRDMLINQLQRQ